jgi:hypothetical protein
MWVAGSYAEPLQSDENSESWPAFLMDPHTDRLSANRQRQVCIWSSCCKLLPHYVERDSICVCLSFCR